MLSGLISTEDLRGVIQTLNEQATYEEVQEMMNEVDANEEGTIDFEDFLSIMSKRLKVSTLQCSSMRINQLILLYEIIT